jgi:cytochrome c peroxidase
MRREDFVVPFYSYVLALGFLAVLTGCSSAPPPPTKVEVDEEFLRTFKPAPAAMEDEKNPITEEKVALGRMLYYEHRLSRGQTLSCNSCHLLDKYGVDSAPTSTGHKEQKGNRNAPTVYYAAGHILQFWDGRAADVEEQAGGPMLNPVEMAMPKAEVVEATLRSMPGYVDAFKRAFPQDKHPVTFANAAKAIASFERKLVTPSRWDKFLEGDKTALTEEEKTGFLTFYKAGCHSCHSGPFLGGRLYQKAGLVKPWPNQKDQGRFEVTKKDHDKMMFKVPSLRNIEKTGPYFHDGSIATLEQAIRQMSEHQTERVLTDTEVQQIATWMKSLTGELPLEYIKKPELPASTAQTPKPQAD